MCVCVLCVCVCVCVLCDIREGCVGLHCDVLVHTQFV